MKLDDILDELWCQTGKCYSEEFLMKEYPEWFKVKLEESK